MYGIYRFSIYNDQENLKNFNYIIDQGFVPNIIEPKYFKDIIYKET